MTKEKIVIFWFRRDLRAFDNHGLFEALKCSGDLKIKLMPLFIFDKTILDKLPKDDHRLSFLHQTVLDLQIEMEKQGGHHLHVFHSTPLKVFSEIFDRYDVFAIYANTDYEPYAVSRDLEIKKSAEQKNIQFQLSKDQVIFEKNEILTDQSRPYTVFTPYKNKWLSTLKNHHLKSFDLDFKSSTSVEKQKRNPIKIQELGFVKSNIPIPKANFNHSILKSYAQTRDFPALKNGTSTAGLALRFGLVSIRETVKLAQKFPPTWLSELIWREFFMQILWHFPLSEKKSFKIQYENIKWRFEPKELELWQAGLTGYPLVDAGMRQLNQTGWMHNRVRMVVASFLTKHLLHHWTHGERYFAERLFDFDLAANVGNWQWSAGTGCDAAPYFRVFNPQTQLEKFDENLEYVKTWVPEYGSNSYLKPMVDHAESRLRALKIYKEGLEK